MARSWKLLLVVEFLLLDLENSIPINRSSSRQTLEFWRNIDVLCNAASICREEFTSERNTTSILGIGEASCCKDCSCSIDCGMQANCCFKDDMRVQIISRSEQECLFPTNVQPRGKDRYRFISYYMYTKYPGEDSLNNGSIRACGNMDTSSVRSLAPVFSKTTGRIYKNINCANEFGVHDGTLWNTLMYCRKKYEFNNRTVYFRTLDDVLFYLERYGKAPGCEYDFIYPGDMSDLSSEQCYQDLIGSCEEGDFEVPSGINLSFDMIKEGCESGLFAPIVLTGHGNSIAREDAYVSYGNIFCAICNGYKLYDQDLPFCLSGPSYPYWRTNTDNVPLVLLLDSAFVSKEKSASSYPIACRSNNGKMDEDNCRRVFCPTAQYRKMDGSCSFAVSHWIATRFAVKIKLVFGQSLRLEDMIGMQHSDIIHPLKWPWEIITNISISYKCTDRSGEGTNIDFLWMIVGNVSPLSRASKVLSDVKQFMSNDWFAYVNGSKIQASVSFFPGEIVCADTNCLRQLQKQNITLLCNVWISLIKETNNLKSKFQVINRLFYCDQVSLNTQEYEMVSSLGIFDRMSGKVFFREEYAVVNGNSEEEYVRICVEESVFKRVDDPIGMACTNIPDPYLFVIVSVIVNINYIY